MCKREMIFGADKTCLSCLFDLHWAGRLWPVLVFIGAVIIMPLV